MVDITLVIERRQSFDYYVFTRFDIIPLRRYHVAYIKDGFSRSNKSVRRASKAPFLLVFSVGLFLVHLLSLVQLSPHAVLSGLLFKSCSHNQGSSSYVSQKWFSKGSMPFSYSGGTASSAFSGYSSKLLVS